MTENKAKGEMHGCIVCGKLYQLIVVHDSNGNFIGSKIMRPVAKIRRDYTGICCAIWRAAKSSLTGNRSTGTGNLSFNHHIDY